MSNANEWEWPERWHGTVNVSRRCLRGRAWDVPGWLIAPNNPGVTYTESTLGKPRWRSRLRHRLRFRGEK